EVLAGESIFRGGHSSTFLQYLVDEIEHADSILHGRFDKTNVVEPAESNAVHGPSPVFAGPYLGHALVRLNRRTCGRVDEMEDEPAAKTNRTLGAFILRQPVGVSDWLLDPQIVRSSGRRERLVVLQKAARLHMCHQPVWRIPGQCELDRDHLVERVGERPPPIPFKGLDHCGTYDRKRCVPRSANGAFLSGSLAFHRHTAAADSRGAHSH